jgi:hypothetical protein
MKDLYRTVKQRLPLGQSKLTASLRMRVIKRHGKLFQRLPPRRQRAYEARHRAGVAEKRTDNTDNLAYAEATLTLKRSRREQEATILGKRSELSDCRFSDHDVARIVAIYNSEAVSSSKLPALRQAALKPPHAPQPEEQQMLEEYPVEDTIDEHADFSMTPWLADLCFRRHVLNDCAIAGYRDGQLLCWGYVFAVQSPHLYLDLVPLVRRETGIDPNVGLPGAERARQELVYDFDFYYDQDAHASQRDVPFDTDELYVLFDLVYLTDTRAVSHGELIPLTEVMERVPAKRGGGARRGRHNGRGSRRKRTLVDNPHLKAFYDRLRERKGGGRGPGEPDSSSSDCGRSASDTSEERSDESSDDDDDDLDDAVVRRGARTLEAMRAIWRMEDKIEMTDFDTVLRGGKWTLRHKRTVCDSVRGGCSTEVARKWAKQFGLLRTFTCSIDKYGEDVACQLCLGWCHRMQYLLDAWERSGPVNFEYSEAFLDAYMEDEAYLDTILAIDVEDDAWDRVMQIRAIRPKRPRRD